MSGTELTIHFHPSRPVMLAFFTEKLITMAYTKYAIVRKTGKNQAQAVTSDEPGTVLNLPVENNRFDIFLRCFIHVFFSEMGITTLRVFREPFDENNATFNLEGKSPDDMCWQVIKLNKMPLNEVSLPVPEFWDESDECVCEPFPTNKITENNTIDVEEKT